MSLRIRPASAFPLASLEGLTWQDTYSHRHLDWIQPSERLKQPFAYVLEDEEGLQAFLSTNPENKKAAWVRLFDCRRSFGHTKAFNALFKTALQDLKQAGISQLYALSFKDWFARLLGSNGFCACDEIISLQLELPQCPAPKPMQDLLLRQMRRVDLPAVLELDLSSFSPAWQLNSSNLEKIYQIAQYATVLTKNTQILGYQMCTANFQGLHLARLAVTPKARGLGLGTFLVQDIISNAGEWLTSALSVNTQKSNTAARNLYSRLGFKQVGTTIPVYERSIETDLDV